MDLYQDSTMELLGGGGVVAPPSTQMYCATTDCHCMFCLRHDKRPRPRGKISMTGGGGGTSNRAASPAASLPPHHCRDTNHFVNLGICKHELQFTCRGYCRITLITQNIAELILLG